MAAYLASIGWQAGAVGRALTFGGILPFCCKPAGWVVDRVAWKRLILVGGSVVLALGALLFASSGEASVVYTAQDLIGIADPFLGPHRGYHHGLVGARLFDCQFGRNQGFNAAGDLFAAAVIAGTRAVLRNGFGGTLMQEAGYLISFLALGGVAFLLLLFAVLETVHRGKESNQLVEG